jgi:multisite-specific tRNA:(cytosine-C5)-methyltransferase
VDKANEKFEGYYNALGLVPEEENDEFWGTMRRELPNSFRFTGSKGYWPTNSPYGHTRF